MNYHHNMIFLFVQVLFNDNMLSFILRKATYNIIIYNFSKFFFNRAKFLRKITQSQIFQKKLVPCTAGTQSFGQVSVEPAIGMFQNFTFRKHPKHQAIAVTILKFE